MKINIQKLMRVLPSFITVFVVVAMCALPVFAVAQEVNIMDYATIEVDGVTKLVTINLPTEWLETVILDGAFGEKYSQTGNVSGFDLTAVDFSSGALKVLFAPLGDGHNPYQQTNYDGRYLDVSDLPNGSVLHYSVSAEMQAASGQSLSFGTGNFNYATVVFQGSLSPLRDPKVVSVPTYIDGYSYSSEYDYVIEDNSKPFVFQHYFNISTDAPSSRWIFRLDEFTITTTLDALKDLQDSLDENNQLLEEIKEQMNINNQNWQDFLDGKKEWQDIVDSSTDKVEDAVDDMNGVSDSLATVPKPEIDIDTLVPDELAGQEYLNYINVIQQIWSNPLISTVTYIMGGLLIISYLLFGERG